jgi:sensor histidine kinase YesM
LCLIISFLWKLSYSQSKPNKIAYLSEIPFYIETDFFISDSVSYQHNYPEIKINILARHFKLIISPKSIAFDEFEFIKLPKSKRKSTNYQYCIVNPLMQVQDWKKVQLDNEFYLLDTLLNENEPIHMLFRDNLNNILESVEIHKQSFIPKVLLYQEVEKSANSLNQKKTDFKQDSEVHSPEIKHVFENIISVQSGKGLAMQLNNPFQNLDSCLYYKFGDSSTQWIKSGHFITISPLRSSNKPYLLELKYHDNETVKTYIIKVQPQWYETIPGILILLISLSLFTIFSIYFIFKIRIKKVQSKRDIIQLRLRAIQSQLNPHFLFNSLSSIQSLVNTDKKKEANHYLSSFSNLMRGTLKNSDVILVSLSEEIELLKAYISLEQLRFNFDYVINIDSKINTAIIEMPPLLLQPIIENAIKHGITHQKHNGKIEINIQTEHENIIIKVSDNGKGILTSTPNITGYGLALTKERIVTINQLLRERSIELHFESSELGTLFIFRFINWLS